MHACILHVFFAHPTKVYPVYTKQTPRKYPVLKPKFCCHLKLNLLFSAFWKFSPEIIEFVDFKAKKMLTNQQLLNQEAF